MRPYRLGLVSTLMLTLLSLEAGANPQSDQAIVEESVFDIAENSDESREGSAFDKIDTPHNSTQNLASHGYYGTAKLVVINKITAKSRQITIDVGKSAYFDNVEIRLHKCWKSSDPYIKNNQMLVSIVENKFDEDQKLIFQGWLISSEPALSSVEHPVYEVLANDCIGHNIK